MSSKRASFIVLEGLDGSGTSTQAKKLHQRVIERGKDAFLTYEPTDGPVGKLIRDGLSGKIISSQDDERIAFSEDALCLLFAADRIEHSRRIEAVRAQNAHVVCDRYILSSIAYQSLDPGISPERVVQVNEGCAIPDVTLFLDVPVEQCLERLERRRDTPTVYETKDILGKIERNYRATRALYEKHFGPLIYIDGTGSASRVHTAVVEKLAAYLSI